MDITLHENNLYLDVHVTDAGEVFLFNLSAFVQPRPENKKWHRLVEVQQAGLDQNDHHGSKHTGTQPGSLLRYRSHTLEASAFGSKLTLTQQWQGLVVISHLQFYTGIPVVRSWTELHNTSQTETHPIEYLSSFALTGLCGQNAPPRDTHGLLYLPHNTWFGEAQWKSYSIRQLGYDAVRDFSMKRIHLSSNGSWPASEYLPMGSYENTALGQTITWQIETAAAWNWEVSDIGEELYLQISGPSLQENGFEKKLRPGGRFLSVPCAVCFVAGGFEAGIQALTQYRRAIRRPNKDNAHPSVIFNDYMNCLMGDPTTEKEIPLIDKAAEVGCKTYCIDCGWYSDGPWWDGVGQWLPSSARFPGGIQEVLHYIRKKGMIPGLWLELEVMGVNCPLAKQVSPSWFFQRSGRPIIDHGRYQLDFRNPEVIAHANRVVDRLVQEYGVGYIKMDYNINAGVGTQQGADSAAEGLLAHTRAYLDWLDALFARYPDLVLENCGSGGMRMEYSLLARQSIQSVTDQTDYLKMAAIACNCPTAVTPEQAAIWSYPLCEGDMEETVFNMVNTLLFRIHQSGHLAQLSPQRLAIVREGIAWHLSVCDRLKTGLPFWPLGLATLSSTHCCVGIDCGQTQYLAVWNIASEQPFALPLPGLQSKAARVSCAFPQSNRLPGSWNAEDAILTLHMQPKTARVFEIRLS